ncbi:hypothetical protein Mbo2_035 [Rhodococcus phage Mbo2]|uniref:Uncharacterized protein n=1 Tax=Rhodococcus phage Mbo2 TaxID=2936911 RepID=A0A9E7IFM1_9CAUD|nr:hypothetical protein Mbo2_035 [Rhodococcus phage Mbo2]
MAYLVVDKDALIALATKTVEWCPDFTEREEVESDLAKLGLVDTLDGIQTCAGAVKARG